MVVQSNEWDKWQVIFVYTVFNIELELQSSVTSTTRECPWFPFPVGPFKVFQGPISFFAAHVQPLDSYASLVFHIGLPHAEPFGFSISVIELETLFLACECLTNHRVIFLNFIYAVFVSIHVV